MKKFKNFKNKKFKNKKYSKTSGSRKNSRKKAYVPDTRKYKKIIARYVETEQYDGEGNSEYIVTIKEMMNFEICYEENDELTRQIVYGQLLQMGVNPSEIREVSTDRYREPEYAVYKNFNKLNRKTGFESNDDYFRDYRASVKKKHDLTTDEGRKDALYEMLEIMGGDSRKKIQAQEKRIGVDIKKLSRNGILFLSSPEYRQSRIDAAISAATAKLDKRLKVLDKTFEESYLKRQKLKDDLFEYVGKSFKQKRDMQQLNEKLNSFEHISQYLGGPFMLLDPKFWKDQLTKLSLAVSNAVSTGVEVYMEHKKEKLDEKIEELKTDRNDTRQEKREEAAMARIDEKGKIKEEETEARLKDKAFEDAVLKNMKAKKSTTDKKQDIRNIYNSKLEEISEMKLAKTGAFGKIKETIDRDKTYQLAVNTLNKAVSELGKEEFKLKKNKKEKEAEEVNVKKEKLRDEITRLTNQKNFNNYNKNGTGETDKQRKYIDLLIDSKDKNAYEILNIVETERERVESEEKENVSTLNVDIEPKPEAKPEPEVKPEAKVEAKPEVKEDRYQKSIDALNRVDAQLFRSLLDEKKAGRLDNVKELDKLYTMVFEEKEEIKKYRRENLSEEEILAVADRLEKLVKKIDEDKSKILNNAIKETPRSEKEPERDNLTLEEEMKVLRGSNKPLKAYHTIYDEDNMMNDLQDQGLSREEARVKTDEYFKKFDEEQRQKEAQKDQAKDKKEDKVKDKLEAKVETKEEPKPEPKPKQEPKPEVKEVKPEPKFENKVDRKEDNKPVELWKREDFLKDLREARDTLESYGDLVEKVQESYDSSSLEDENPWEKKNDLANVKQDIEMVKNMIEEIRETIPKERNLTKVDDDMGSVFERRDEIGSVFEKPKVKGEIDMSRFNDLKANFALIEKTLRENYKPKIEPLKKERLAALAKPKLDARERRKKLEQTYNETIGKEKEAEKQEAKKQEELKKQQQEQEKKDKQAKELKPKQTPEIGGPHGFF